MTYAFSSPATAIFDFDGTIADSIDDVILVYNQAAASLGVRSVSMEDVMALKAMKPMAALGFLGVPLWKLPFIVRAVRSGMRHRVPALRPFAGLDGALRELQTAGIRCCILSTNSQQNIEAFLSLHSMSYFDMLAGGSSVFGKAGHLKKLVKSQRLAPQRVFYVGDEVRDVNAAKEAKVRSVAVSWGYSDRAALVAEQPEILVDTPKELATALIAAAR